eukprot:3649594-Prorocentrum_lima.AAC.1
MTSSLVGSEMCIRDRLPPWLSYSAALSHNQKKKEEEEEEEEEEEGSVGCLLYTSDAADDM